jgi:F-type H+-transporting ATPase subunit gamma
VSGASESLARKIDGARDLSSVVRSMKALAVSSIGQYERAVEALQEYYRSVELGLSVILREFGPAGYPSRARSPATTGIIIFGSDQGLVGRFNEVLMEFTTRTTESLPNKITRTWAIGERMHQLAVDSSMLLPTLLPVPYSVEAITPLVGELIIEVEAARARGIADEIYVFHNQPQASSTYQPVKRRLLPLDSRWQREMSALSWPTRALPQVIDGPAAAIDAFIRGYLFVLLFQASAQSLASENSSRLAAMQRAEDNIATILEDLTRRFHRLRQASIDEELFEVVSGYEALSKRTTAVPE